MPLDSCLRVVAACWLGLAVGGAAAQGLPKVVVSPELCGSLHTHYGPYDYRTDRAQLPIVENYHFRPEMEALSPTAKGELGGQFDYTLHAFPNHHRALVAMARLGERKKTNKPLKAKYTVECYFERAVRFRPDDVVARMLFADYLTKRGEPDQALPQLDTVGKLAGDNPLTHYNLGLLYLGLGRHDKAAEHARRAMDLGFTRPELSDQLKAKGAWPSSSAASAPARTP